MSWVVFHKTFSKDTISITLHESFSFKKKQQEFYLKSNDRKFLLNALAICIKFFQEMFRRWLKKCSPLLKCLHKWMCVRACSSECAVVCVRTCRKLRSQHRIQIHLHLFISFIVTNIVWILWQNLIYNDRLHNQDRDTIIRKDMVCRGFTSRLGQAVLFHMASVYRVCHDTTLIAG